MRGKFSIKMMSMTSPSKGPTQKCKVNSVANSYATELKVLDIWHPIKFAGEVKRHIPIIGSKHTT